MRRLQKFDPSACLRIEPHDGTVQYDGETSTSSDSDGSASGAASDTSHNSNDEMSVSREARFNQTVFYCHQKKKRSRKKVIDVVATAETNIAMRRAIRNTVDVSVHFTPVSFRRPKLIELEIPRDALPCPPPLDHATITAFERSSHLVVFGGNLSKDGACNTTYLFDQPKLIWEIIKVPNAPPPRCGHCAHACGDVPPTAALKTFNGKTKIVAAEAADSPTVLIFGGANLGQGQYFNDVWAFDLNRRNWQCLHRGTCPNVEKLANDADPPCPRWKAVCAYRESRLYIFGGESGAFEVLSDLHVFDLMRGQWRSIRTNSVPAPSPRYLHAACTIGDRMFVCGGIGSNTTIPIQDDTWILELPTLLWRRMKSGVTPEVLQQSKKNHSYQIVSSGSPFIDPIRFQHHLNGSNSVDHSAHKSNTDISSQLNPSSLNISAVTTGDAGRSIINSTEREALAGALSHRNLEGHVVLPFDDMIILHGGRFGRHGGYNNDLFVFDVPNERWLRIAPMQSLSQDDGSLDPSTVIPPPRCFHCAAPITHYNVTAGTAHAQGLHELRSNGVLFTSEKETGQYIEALEELIRHQTAAKGILTTHKSKPLLAHHSHCFLFGGTGESNHNFNDCYKVELRYDDSLPSLE